MRRREPLRRPLNVPAAAVLAARASRPSTRTAPGERAAFLRDCSAALVPARPRVGRAARSAPERRFRVAAELNGAEQIICATGFKRGFRHDPLLARLVDEHELETHGRWIVLAPDCTVPALTDDERTLVVAGVAAPVGVSRRPTRSSGAKYAARGFLRR